MPLGMSKYINYHYVCNDPSYFELVLHSWIACTAAVAQSRANVTNSQGCCWETVTIIKRKKMTHINWTTSAKLALSVSSESNRWRQKWPLALLVLHTEGRSESCWQTTWENDVQNNTRTAESIKSNGLWEGCKVKEAGTEQDILAAEMDGQIVGQETEESEGYSISGFLQFFFYYYFSLTPFPARVLPWSSLKTISQ